MLQYRTIEHLLTEAMHDIFRDFLGNSLQRWWIFKVELLLIVAFEFWQPKFLLFSLDQDDRNSCDQQQSQSYDETQTYATASLTFCDPDILPQNQTWLLCSSQLQPLIVEKFALIACLYFASNATATANPEPKSFENAYIIGLFKACCTFHRSECDKSPLNLAFVLVNVHLLVLPLKFENSLFNFGNLLLGLLLNTFLFTIPLLVSLKLSIQNQFVNFEQKFVTCELFLSKVNINNVFNRVIPNILQLRNDLRFMLYDLSNVQDQLSSQSFQSSIRFNFWQVFD